MELIYTKFVSLIASSPVIQTLLPLSPSGEVRAGTVWGGGACVQQMAGMLGSAGLLPLLKLLPLPLPSCLQVCDINGTCVDAAEDEIFKLTTREGQLVVEAETVRTETGDFDSGLIFEQDPVQIVDALLPLYMNASLLRSLQEALASELAARMNAMSNASDNAAELKRNLTLIMNRKRQAKITTGAAGVDCGGQRLGVLCGCADSCQGHGWDRQTSGRVALTTASLPPNPAELTEIVAGASSV